MVSFSRTNPRTRACLTLDLAKQIAQQDPGSLVGKSLTLSYAASHSNDAGGFQVGFQVQRVDLQCRLSESSNAIRHLAAWSAEGRSGVMIPLSLAKTMDAEVVASAQAFLRDPSLPKSYAAVTVKVNQARFTQDVEDRHPANSALQCSP